jgi:cell division septal protein FtsQ
LSSGDQASRASRKTRSLGLGRLRSGKGVEKPVAKSRRWRVAWLKLLVFVVLMGLGSLVAYASADAKFFIYEGRIVGARHSDAVEIYRIAGVHEQSIFWTNPQQVARRVIQLEGIRAVRVRLELPSRVIIEVEEREPAVMWRAGQQQRDWWLDGEGVVLPYHGDVNDSNTVFVVDSSDRELQVGERIEPVGMAQSVLQLAKAVPGIRVFFYEPDRGLSFTQQVDGAEWPVYVGTTRDLGRKIQVMQALTDHLQGGGVRPRYVDVRWADHPVYGKAPADDMVGGQ